tara:strand:- start:235 stop:1527 length:1293 start_codon:yes stop_codon:yes gene_type:complete
MEETVKNFWNNRPCNVRHSKKEFLSEEYFNEVEKKRYLVESHIPKFCDFKKYKGKKILEIGCGIGTDAVMFAREGCDYHGLELSDESLKITKERFKVFDLDGKFFSLNSENMSIFEDNTFDLVYSFGVIHHTESPEVVLDEIYRILKPEGEAKIMLYAKDSWKKMMIDNGLDQFEAQSGCPIAFTYSNDEIYELFNKFSNIRIEQDHIFPYSIPEYKNNEYKFVDYFDSMPKDIFSSLKKILGWHLDITCTKNINILNNDIIECKYNTPIKHLIIDNVFNENCQIKDSIKYLTSPEFINKLEKLTGVFYLEAEKNISENSVNTYQSGFNLDKTLDSNKNLETNMYKSVKLIFSLNDDWKETDGGLLELHGKNDKKIIEPIKNRIVIYPANSKSIYSITKVNKEQKNLIIWYYTKDKQKYTDYNYHNTIKY